MAAFKVQAASVYVKGTKYAECEQNTLEINSGDEGQFGDAGYLGHSDGAMTTKLTCKGIIPLPGQAIDLPKLMDTKTAVDVSLGPINGQIKQITMRVVQATIESTHKNGAQMGTFVFEGGPPRSISL